MVSLRVVLAGGPEKLCETARVREVRNLTDTVKLSFASGYEHFAHSGETAEIDGYRLPVFQWCGQTRIAE
ncbi:DUF5988 family protein [Amycolatopsis sp. H20-H5]|uniref:DUF5988 family protein n=1 Tax=Amycolatopsis sp. H20-H5 TaxID=3046309 RepID=UPI002DBF95BF|nr:DUF5988 family protein [Amycolatopsis sp. H20-H5]MEC3979335.1 DUF5988 family protein [Amycolatopsis sp. H20-H5]